MKKFSFEQLKDYNLIMNNNDSYAISLIYNGLLDRAEIVIYNYSEHYGLIECTLRVDSRNMDNILKLYGFELIRKSDRIKGMLNKALKIFK